MQIMKRACGRRHIADFDLADLVSFDSEMAKHSGIPFAGIGPP